MKFPEPALAPDAVNSVDDGTSFYCGTPPSGNLSQSFTPSRPTLPAIDIRFMAFGAFPAAGTTATINVREGRPAGPIVASATAFIPGPLAGGTKINTRFDFLPPAHVTAGNTYVIEWVSPASEVLLWMGNRSNTYSGGNMFGCPGNSISGWDLTFTSYRLGR